MKVSSSISTITNIQRRKQKKCSITAVIVICVIMVLFTPSMILYSRGDGEENLVLSSSSNMLNSNSKTKTTTTKTISSTSTHYHKEESRISKRDDGGATDYGNKMKKKNIGLVSYCVGEKYKNLQELVTYNQRSYANQYDNIMLFQGNSTVLPMEPFITPPAWLKVAYLYQLLLLLNNNDNNIEWFVWIDCDALIARFDITIEDLLNDKINVQNNHHVIVSEDINDSPFNSGIMFIRNTNWSRDFMSRALSKSTNDKIRNHMFWEQKAFHELYFENLYDEQTHLYIVPNGRSLFNGWAGVANGRPKYKENQTFIWHRLHCRNTEHKNNDNENDDIDDCCFRFSKSFFCSKTPRNTQLKKNDDDNDGIIQHYSYPEDFCIGVPPWTQPSGTNHC